MHKIFPALQFPGLWYMVYFSIAAEQTVLKVGGANQQQFHFALHYVGQTLRKGTVGMAYLCSW